MKNLTITKFYGHQMKNIIKIKGISGSFLGGVYPCFVVVDENSQFGCLPGENHPYIPIGGRSALKQVLEILEFRHFNSNGLRFQKK